ncbi:LacI family DNA-binding transcriptional regulator [Bacillus mojavensis]|uniref:LacI family DNA-binding transcriptional regulator n=1 Tax=Bacillus mojavensis TaxID=72360 RepID=UPI002DBC209D|nr:LacI family DNA-binding transcriptional regulator [Bacillus mojavensis]MEC1612949.1 LacI family DNA-binding transcriptional regulator [Bacillus mojavensis]MEC1619930.1 LacI family DNA-binding transcriptional regulator [Bacillus mojavensis]MEC1658408.1 LacI family DNA-binding transcriptional regulator [Bacillus mojavensis]MEC1682586.1 LacI family DNA-binding transcriptional regulator [Bacillus mojavensis]MEC1690192.1 LacI family DNA-binding transcriptional regulator [Bacillus mojavensis]
MVRIKDIALKANVSNATVSRILNEDHSLSVAGETRQRVISIAEELGYQTVAKRRKARGQKQRAQPLIGVLSCLSPDEERQDPYFSSIRKGIEKECFEQEIFITNSIHLGSFQEHMFRELGGIIVIGRVHDEAVQHISGRLEHAVFINHSPDSQIYDSIGIDFEAAARQAIDHLFDLGYKRLGYIGGQEKEHTLREGQSIRRTIEDKRQTAFLQSANPQPEHVLVGDYSMREGYRLMKKAITQGNLPEAFFIASDSMAIGALKALREADLHVPRDTAIVSFNGIEEAEFASTPLTTVKVYTEEMGRTGVKQLLDRFNGRTIPHQVTLPTTLIIRQSCGYTAKEVTQEKRSSRS